MSSKQDRSSTALVLAAPFVETLRELRRMRYLWNTPVRMDNASLVAVLGAEPHTPLDIAIEETLQGLGCLGAQGGDFNRGAVRRG
jgi:hypothetical protein